LVLNGVPLVTPLNNRNPPGRPAPLEPRPACCALARSSDSVVLRYIGNGLGKNWNQSPASVGLYEWFEGAKAPSMGDVPDPRGGLPSIERICRRPDPGTGSSINYRGKKNRPAPNYTPLASNQRTWLGRHRLIRRRPPTPPMVAESQDEPQRGCTDQIGQNLRSGQGSLWRGTRPTVAGICFDVSGLHGIRTTNQPPLSDSCARTNRGRSSLTSVIQMHFLSR